MRCKKMWAGRLMCGVAVGAMTLAPVVARAQDTTGTTGADAGMGMTSSQPTQVTGTVVRYYTDRSGFVTAADVQTANGIQMVHFAPNMGANLSTTYPAGGQQQVSLWVTPHTRLAGHWNVVGVGTAQPAGGFMTPYMLSDVDLLKAEPYILAGSKMIEVEGDLSGIITDEQGEILGLSLSNVKLDEGLGIRSAAMTGGDTSGGAMAGGMGGTMQDNVLVRVPREMRHHAPGVIGTARVTPLFRGSSVRAVGYVEAPRFGVLSRFGTRIIANALVVNGRAVGAVGLPMMKMKKGHVLLRGVDIAAVGGATSPEEERAMRAGYTVYSPGGLTPAPNTMNPGAPGSGTTGTGTDTGTGMGADTGATGDTTGTGTTDTDTRRRPTWGDRW